MWRRHVFSRLVARVAFLFSGLTAVALRRFFSWYLCSFSISESLMGNREHWKTKTQDFPLSRKKLKLFENFWTSCAMLLPLWPDIPVLWTQLGCDVVGRESRTIRDTRRFGGLSRARFVWGREPHETSPWDLKNTKKELLTVKFKTSLTHFTFAEEHIPHS